MLISELAQRTNLPIHTIRFYEREGLIDERFFHRGDNRYRYYHEEAVERIEMIKQGQSAGYTITEVRELLLTWDAGELTTDATISYLEDKVGEISRKILELEQIKGYLTQKLDSLRISPETAEIERG
ncbi:MAG: MerR family transcriptional regulator [Aggregatilineales bacterium]